VRVRDYWPNCEVDDMPPPQAIPAPANHGAFTNMAVLALPESTPDSEQTRKAALVEVDSGKTVIGTYLVVDPREGEDQQAFNADGHVWTMSMLFAPMLGGNLLSLMRPGDQDSMINFPEEDLKAKGELKHEGLPVTLRIKGYWPKCLLYHQPGPTSIQPLVTQGSLAGTFVTPQPLVTDSDHRNMPAAVVELLNNRGSLGTWLLWTAPERPHEILDIGGKAYELGFQFKRYYRPFRLGLVKFSHDKYKGTDIPKNFSSRIHLVNPKGNEDREVTIKMNNPLRYAGTTYYQAGFDQRRTDVTILEVVTNPSWLTPYLAVIMVGLGLIIQFGMHLIGFATKRRTA
jgi:hypothetical protein